MTWIRKPSGVVSIANCQGWILAHGAPDLLSSLFKDRFFLTLRLGGNFCFRGRPHRRLVVVPLSQWCAGAGSRPSGGLVIRVLVVRCRCFGPKPEILSSKWTRPLIVSPLQSLSD
jgi:hypothetical protein